MGLKRWAMVRHTTGTDWVQFVSNEQPPTLRLYDGETYYQSIEKIVPLMLPDGLSALKFAKVSRFGEWPILFEDPLGNTIMELGADNFFVNGRSVYFTHEVQEVFDLYFPIEADKGCKISEEV